MNISRLRQVLVYHEGLRLKPYCDKTGRTFISGEDCGKLTIGVGRNLEDVGISEEEAMFMLHNDIKRVVSQLDSHIPWWRGLDDVRQEILVNMAFNLGIKGLLGFRKMLEALKNGDYDRAAEEMMDSLWARQVGRRTRELSYAMKHGKYPDSIPIKDEPDKLLEYLNKIVWEELNNGW